MPLDLSDELVVHGRGNGSRHLVPAMWRDPPTAPVEVARVDDRATTLRLSVLTLGEIKEGADLLEDGPRKVRVEAWLDELRTTFADRILPVDEAVALRRVPER